MNNSKNRIPLVDLEAQFKGFSREMEEAILRVVRSGRFIGGSEVEVFEAAFAEFCGTNYCIGVASGTDALRLALKACGIREGDEVVTVSNTFIATAEAISLVGAKPAFVDISSDTYTMDPQKLDEFLTHCAKHSKPVKAIIPVHLYGHPADMDPLLNLAKRYNLRVIEDACQAHGAVYYGEGSGSRDQGTDENNGRKVGSMGDVGCFSFYPGKNLGAYGDGGAVVTNDEKIAEKIKMLRDHGRLGKKYEHEIEGCNSRLDTLQAAVLNVKLKYLEEWNEKRRKNAKLYDELLGAVPDVIIPKVLPCVIPVYHLYVVRVKKRDRIRQLLSEGGIATGIHYPIPLHLQKAYSYLGYKAGNFPVTEEVAQEILSLPMFPELREEEIFRIVKTLKEVLTDVSK